MCKKVRKDQRRHNGGASRRKNEDRKGNKKDPAVYLEPLDFASL